MLEKRFLTVLRHAKAKRSSASGGDLDRPLARSASGQLKSVFHALARAKEPPDWIVASPALRARQTAEIAADLIGYTRSIGLIDRILRRGPRRAAQSSARDARQRAPCAARRPQPRRRPTGVRPLRGHERARQPSISHRGNRPFRIGYRPLEPTALGQVRTSLPHRAALRQGAAAGLSMARAGVQWPSLNTCRSRNALRNLPSPSSDSSSSRKSAMRGKPACACAGGIENSLPQCGRA